MSGSEGTPLAQRLADAFIDLIRDGLTVGELAEVRARNRAYEGSTECASNEYLDAELRMSLAFRAVLGRARADSSTSDIELLHTAWMLAKNAQFTRSITLIENANGSPAYAYSIRGMVIKDPYTSDCGQFRVDPGRDYGLTPEEVTALVEANARLRVEPQIEAETQPTRPVAPQRVTLSDIRERYPKLQPLHTGGGCMALCLDCEGNAYILITDTDGAQIPDASATAVAVGRYAANGDQWGDVETVLLEAVPGWIDSTLTRATQPQNVGDYFIVKLGEDPQDASLDSLPLDTPCGEDCQKAIDSGAVLITHIRAALGHDGAIIPGTIPGTHTVRRTPEGNVIAITRLIVGVYWRG